MSDDRDDNESPEDSAPDDAAENDDAIGYRKPPRASRFKKGESGNPHGRPKGARGLRVEAREVLDEKIPITTQQGKKRRVSARQALLMKQREKGFKGDTRAAQLLLDFAHDEEAREDARRADAERDALNEHDIELIKAALKRLGTTEED